MTTKKKYTGPWNRQCPYCFGRRVQQDSQVLIEGGERYFEWLDSATCITCRKGWVDTDVVVAGCPHCGVHYGGDITTEEVSYRRQDGTVIEYVALMLCQECGCFYDQETSEIIAAETITWLRD